MDGGGGERPRPRIVEATNGDVAAMAATLSAAFMDDPALSWIIPDAAERARRFARFFPLIVRSDMAAGSALRSPGGEVVTLWREPDRVSETVWETLRELPAFALALGRRVGRGLKVSNAMEAHYPRGFPYYYLHFAGVAPAFQGQGWGGTAIRAGLERAAARGLPVHLETATRENVTIYERLGFTVTCEYDVPGGGPHFWGMLRPAG
ncbi:GNAT family N-acetyltransferase [Novosphingobium tardum]|uniref:GNAT family N-acetyltransferase n=2 Tax=Novosphingobium tardum TaxID=1538021 RepID=A0ABV8RL84_9SPHN